MEVTSNITVNCVVCNEEVLVKNKLDHERHHKALKTLKYKNLESSALSLDSVLKRRKQILKKILLNYEQTPEDPDLNRRINGVNEAFDAARSEMVRGLGVYSILTPLVDKFRANDGGLCFNEKEIHHDVKSSPVWGSLPSCIDSAGTSYATNIQSKDTMEDRMTTHPQFFSLDKRKEITPTAFFIGVYDGHRGHQAAELTQTLLHNFIKQEIQEIKSSKLIQPTAPSDAESKEILEALGGRSFTTNQSDDEAAHSPSDIENFTLSHEEVLKCCKKSFKRMDDYLSWGINETSKVRWSSCSVATCIIDDVSNVMCDKKKESILNEQIESEQSDEIGRLYMANTGSVEAYLYHNNKPYALTQKHTTENNLERKRIENLGGKIVGHGKNKLVNGLVSTTRGLGNHGDVPLRRCVTCHPYTSTARITKNTQFVVIATSSVWSVFSVEEIFHLVKNTEVLVKQMQRKKFETKSSQNPNYLKKDEVEKKPLYTRINEREEEETTKIEEVEIVYPADEEDEEGATSDRNFHTIENHIDRISRESKNVTLTGLAYKTWLSAAMSNRIVQAAIQAGATDNVSAVVILFKGFFD